MIGATNPNRWASTNQKRIDAHNLLQKVAKVAKYASGTKVPADQSRSEIERTLVRFGADQFGYANKQDAAVIVFRAHGRHIRFMLPLPIPKEISSQETRDREVRRRRVGYADAVRAQRTTVGGGGGVPGVEGGA